MRLVIAQVAFREGGVLVVFAGQQSGYEQEVRNE